MMAYILCIDVNIVNCLWVPILYNLPINQYIEHIL